MARVTSTDAAPDRSGGAYDRTIVRQWVEELEALSWKASPRVALLVESPRSGEREVREKVTVVEGQGFAGDYERKDYYKGERVPGREVSAIAQEVLGVVGVEPAVVGDNLVTVGIDLRALQPGDRLAVGEEVILRRSERPHRPCTPFRERTSPEAFAAVARSDFRGALFYVERGGTVHAEDPIRVLRSEASSGGDD